jgi:hypothetical protein
MVLCGVLLAARQAGGSDKNIFDDDWKPPAKVQPPPAPLPPPPKATTQTAIQPPAKPPADPVPPRPDIAGRRPVPDVASQAKSRKVMREVYAKALADKSAAGLQKLSEELMVQAAQSASNPSDQFVLLVGAIEAAKQSGRLRLCLDACEALVKAFEIDFWALKIDAATNMKFAESPPPTVSENFAAGVAIIDELTRREAYDEATKLLASLNSSARAFPAFKATLQSRTRTIAYCKSLRESLPGQLDRLQHEPGDREASLAAGRYYCIALEDWPTGLPFLAAGSNPLLKAAAIADSGNPTNADAQATVADAWWVAAERETAGPAQQVWRERSAAWYRRALGSGLTGLTKALAQKRIEGIAAAPEVKGTAPISIAIGTLESKKEPVLAATAGLVPFKVPRHDQWWVGSNGVLLDAPEAWERTGTSWTCKQLILRPWGLRLVHPWGNGHLLVSITSKSVSIQPGGEWQDQRELATKLELEADPRNPFPLKRDQPYSIRSVLTATGEYSIYIDDALVAKTKAPVAQPLKTTGFTGKGLPPALKKGQAAAIIDHAYHMGNSVAADLTFTLGR